MGARRGGTIVRVIRLRDHKAIRSRVISGRYGIATAAFYTRGGVSADGKTLVLPSLDRGATTRSQFVSTATLRARKVIWLDGLLLVRRDLAGRTHRVPDRVPLAGELPRVRALDVESGGLYARVVADKREAGELMAGYPVTQAAGT